MLLALQLVQEDVSKERTHAVLFLGLLKTPAVREYGSVSQKNIIISPMGLDGVENTFTTIYMTSRSSTAHSVSRFVNASPRQETLVCTLPFHSSSSIYKYLASM